MAEAAEDENANAEDSRDDILSGIPCIYGLVNDETAENGKKSALPPAGSQSLIDYSNGLCLDVKRGHTGEHWNDGSTYDIENQDAAECSNSFGIQFEIPGSTGEKFQFIDIDADQTETEEQCPIESADSQICKSGNAYHCPGQYAFLYQLYP